MRTRCSRRSDSELDANGEAALQLGNQIRGLGDMEGARGDEEHVIGANCSVLGRNARAFDDR